MTIQFLVWVWAIIFTHQNSCDWTYPVVRHEQSVPPKGVHGNFSAAKHMFAENLPPSLHRLILLKEQHGCSARKLGIKGYFWTCECHQLYLPVASCFTWRLVEKDIRGGKGVTKSVYTQWHMVRSIELLPKKKSQVSLPCIVFVSDRCQALSLVEQKCPAIRLLFVQITLITPWLDAPRKSS